MLSATLQHGVVPFWWTCSVDTSRKISKTKVLAKGE
jgi:hypothetical protein